MNKLRQASRLITLLLCALSYVNVSAMPPVKPPSPAVNAELARHQAQWQPRRIEHIAGPAHVAIGYSWSNMVFVEGENSTIVIDMGWSKAGAAAALADYRKISDKPIKTVLLTHPHLDHFGGVGGLFPDGIAESVTIIGPHESAAHASEGPLTAPYYKGTIYRAMGLQMGLMLPEGLDGTVGIGTGPVVRLEELGQLPTFSRKISSREAIIIDGVEIELVPMPGDTQTHMAVWLPEQKIIVSGDLPALAYFSTPRLDLDRDINKLINSNKLLSELPSSHAVSMHRAKVFRGQEAQQLFSDAHDYLKLVRDQTYRAINNNLSPDDLVNNFPLPPRFANNPLMKDHYHRFSWMVRGLYNKEVGWLSGDMTQIVKPLGEHEAQRIIKLAGGKDKVWRAAQQAYQEDDFGWAVQLASYLIRLEPESRQYKQFKAHAERAIAYRSRSAIERHYLLTDALVLEGKIDPVDSGFTYPWVQKLIRKMPISNVINRYLGTKLRAEDCLDLELAATFNISDRDELHRVDINHGVALYSAGVANSTTVEITLTASTFYDIFLGKLSWEDALQSNVVSRKGNIAEFDRFVRLFEW